MRYTGASVGYQLASVFGGGFAPLIAVALLAAGGDEPYLVALYMMGMGVITVVATLLRTRDVPVRHRGRRRARASRPSASCASRPSERETAGSRVTHETVFTLEATPIKFGAGRRPPTRAGSSSASAPRG